MKKADGSPTLLVLPFRSFGPASCAELCRGLYDNPTLTELLCSGHAIGREGAAAVGLLRASSSCTIRRLAVGHAEFGEEGVLALVAGFTPAPAGRKATGVEFLDLELKGLAGERGGRALAELVAVCPALAELRVARNALGPLGAAALVAGMRGRADSLAVLDLSATELGGAAVEAALAGGGAASRLHTLCLSGNPQLGDEGAASIGRLVLLGWLPALRRLCAYVRTCVCVCAAAVAVAVCAVPSVPCLQSVRAHECCACVGSVRVRACVCVDSVAAAVEIGIS